MKKKQIIANGAQLSEWRKKHAMTTEQAARVFHRTRRSIQLLEKDQHRRGFPQVLDDLARLYEIEHRPKKPRAKVAAAA